MQSAISSGHTTGGRTPRTNGKDQTSQDKEEPSVISTRPKQQQLALNFADNFVSEDEATRAAQEPQGGQSCAAVTEKSALDSLSTNLMEQVVATENMERAWRNVKANRGAGTDAKRWSGPESSFSASSSSVGEVRSVSPRRTWSSSSSESGRLPDAVAAFRCRGCWANCGSIFVDG